MSGAIACLAPAKINLALHVTGRRDDGYHLLDSLVVFARFGDRLTISAAETDTFAVTGPFAAQAPADAGNLVIRARDALRHAFGLTESVAIELQKNLPVASGVGGGSADAAATLRGLAELWHLDIDDRVNRIALSLGADVPMCLAGRPTRARGIGEQLTPVDGLPPLGIVLVNAGAALPTASVFAALEKADRAPMPDLPKRPDFYGLCDWLVTTRNDLEPPARALQPSIRESLDLLRATGAQFARMSGSGATCFGLLESGNLAKRTAAAIRARRPTWFVAATRTLADEIAHEPA